MKEHGKTYNRVNRILEIANRMAENAGYETANRISDITMHVDGYAEPGYDVGSAGIILLSNWNNVDRYDSSTRSRTLISNLPSRLSKIFEKMNVDVEWDDEWVDCCECSKLIRTQPDSYSWKKNYILTANGAKCGECVSEEAEFHLESLEGDCNHINTLSDIDPEECGYVKVVSGTSGYAGVDHSKVVMKRMNAAGIKRFLINLDESCQFECKWSLYVHESEAHLLKGDVAE